MKEIKNLFFCSLVLLKHKPILLFRGGYQLMPEVFEFWCGGKGRMHDRVVFKKQSMKSSDQHNELIKNGDDGWQYEFIAP